jgi:hypothetical protein
MSKIKGWIVGILVKKYVAGWLGSLMSMAKGYKTQVGTILIIGITICKHLAIIPPEFSGVADQILTMLYGATGISAGDKVRRYWEVAKSAGDEVLVNVEVPK